MSSDDFESASNRPGRRCDYCGEHKRMTKVLNGGSIMCIDCDPERDEA